MDTYADDLAELMESLDLKDAYIVINNAGLAISGDVSGHGLEKDGFSLRQ
jgi:hypothetical protein